MGNLKIGHYRVVGMDLLTVLGSIASILGFILTVVLEIKHRRVQKMKESNRHDQG